MASKKEALIRIPSKLTRFLSLLFLLPIPAIAETVFYCEMKAFVGVSQEGFSNYRPERFNLKVSKEGVTFGSTGYMSSMARDGTISPSFYISDDHWQLKTPYSNVELYKGKFLYTTINGPEESAIAISAHCEVF